MACYNKITEVFCHGWVCKVPVKETSGIRFGPFVPSILPECKSRVNIRPTKFPSNIFKFYEKIGTVSSFTEVSFVS